MSKNILHVMTLELQRKRKEFNPKAALVIIPLLVLFIALFTLVVTTSYQDKTPVHRMLTNNGVIMKYVENSTFILEETYSDNENILAVVGAPYPRILSERTFVQRAGSEALKARIREVNTKKLEQEGPIVLVGVMTRTREEIITEQPKNPFALPNSSAPLAQPAPTQGQQNAQNIPLQITPPVPLDQELSIPKEQSTSVKDSAEAQETSRVNNEITETVEETTIQNVMDAALVTTEPIVDGEYTSVAELDSLSHIKHVFVAIELVVILNFCSVLYAASLFQEKLSKRSTLLFVSPIKSRDVIIGKMLPYFGFSIIGMMIILFVNGMLVKYIVPSLIIGTILAILYFSVAYCSAVLARSQKEFSFLSVFFISIVSLYLIIPAFVANYSAIANASILTPLVLFVQDIGLSWTVLFFLSVIYLLASLALWYLGTLLFNFEEFYSVQPIMKKIMRVTELFVKNPAYALTYAMLSIPVVWLAEVILIVVLLVTRLPFALPIIVLVAAYFEEIARNLPLYAVFKGKKFKEVLKPGIGYSLATGIGFGLGEKMLLFIMIAPFTEGYALLVLGSFIVPLLLHSLLSYIFIVIHPLFPKGKYWITCMITALIHATINLLLIHSIT